MDSALPLGMRQVSAVPSMEPTLQMTFLPEWITDRAEYRKVAMHKHPAMLLAEEADDQSGAPKSPAPKDRGDATAGRVVQWLRSVSVFSHCSQRILETLGAIIRCKTLKAGGKVRFGSIRARLDSRGDSRGETRGETRRIGRRGSIRGGMPKVLESTYNTMYIVYDGTLTILPVTGVEASDTNGEAPGDQRREPIGRASVRPSEGETHKLSAGDWIGTFDLLSTDQSRSDARFFPYKAVTASGCTLLQICSDDFRAFTSSSSWQETDVWARVKFLRSYDMLAKWSRARLLKLANSLELKLFAPKALVVKQGDAPTHMYFLQSGECMVERRIEFESTNRWPTANNRWQGISTQRTEVRTVQQYLLQICSLTRLADCAPRQNFRRYLLW